MSIVRVSSPYANTSSMFTLKWREILNARSREGTYFPFSMARMVCRVTPIAFARSSCVRSCIARYTLILFFIGLPIPELSGIVEPEPDIQEDHQTEKPQLNVSNRFQRHEYQGHGLGPAIHPEYTGKAGHIEQVHHGHY